MHWMHGLWALVLATAPAAAVAQADQGAAAGGEDPLAAPADASAPVASRSVAEQEEIEREAERERAEAEDDGRDADLLWVEAGLGGAFVDLVTFRQQNFYPSAERTQGFGPMAEVAAGFRVKWLTLGARASLTTLSGAFDLGTVGLDVGLRIPFGFLEPHVRLGLGYGWVGQADYRNPRLSATSVYGLVVEGGAGLELYLGDLISIGATASAAVLNLTRQDVRTCGGGGASSPDCNVAGVNLEEDGDSVGLQVRGQAHVALHF